MQDRPVPKSERSGASNRWRNVEVSIIPCRIFFVDWSISQSTLPSTHTFWLHFRQCRRKGCTGECQSTEDGTLRQVSRRSLLSLELSRNQPKPPPSSPPTPKVCQHRAFGYAPLSIINDILRRYCGESTRSIYSEYVLQATDKYFYILFYAYNNNSPLSIVGLSVLTKWLCHHWVGGFDQLQYLGLGETCFGWGRMCGPHCFLCECYSFLLVVFADEFIQEGFVCVCSKCNVAG